MKTGIRIEQLPVLYMRIDLSRPDIAVPQHFLDAAQICTALQQMCCIAVTQLVRCQMFPDIRFNTLLIQQKFNGTYGNFSAEPIDKKQICLLFQVYGTYDVFLFLQDIHCPVGDRYQPFLAALPQHPDKACFQVDAVDRQADCFRYSESA